MMSVGPRARRSLAIRSSEQHSRSQTPNAARAVFSRVAHNAIDPDACNPNANRPTGSIPETSHFRPERRAMCEDSRRFGGRPWRLAHQREVTATAYQMDTRMTRLRNEPNGALELLSRVGGQNASVTTF